MEETTKRKRTRKSKEIKLVPVGVMLLANDKGGTLELLTWRGEPTVLIDGQYLVRRTTLIQSLTKLRDREGGNGIT